MPEVSDLYVTVRAVTAPFTDALVKADASVTGLTERLAAMDKAVTGSSTRFAALGKEADGMAAKMAAAGRGATQASTGLGATAKSAENTESRLANLGTRALGLGAVFEKVAKWGSIGLAGVGAVSVDMAAKFESAMTRINTQAGVGQTKLAGLKNGVLDLAGQVGFSPDSLAESLFHVESNFESMGISSQKALEYVKVAAQGAAVGGSDLVDVTNALTAAVASNIPGVQDLSQAMGVLNTIVGSGDMTMQDLTDAMGSGMVATVKGFGLSIQDVGAGLEVFGDNNIRGAAAGTALRMSVEALAKPVATATSTLERLGLTTDTLARDMQKGGLKLALEDLADRFKKAGITAKEQGQVITDLFGKKAGTGLNVLLNQMDRVESKYTAMNEGASKFGDAWTTASRTLTQQFKSIEFGAEAIGIKIGTVLIPYVSRGITAIEGFGRRAVKDLTDLWDIYGPAVSAKLTAAARQIDAAAQKMIAPMEAGITNLAVKAIPPTISAVEKLETVFKNAAAAAKPVVSGLDNIYHSMTSSNGALEVLKGRLEVSAGLFGSLAGSLTSVSGVLRPIGELVGSLARAFADLPGPIQLTALSMLAMRPFRSQLDDLKTSVVGFGKSGVEAFRGVGDAILYQRVLAAGAGKDIGSFGAAMAELEARIPVVGAMGTSFREAASSIRTAGGNFVGFRSALGGAAAAIGTGAKAGLSGAMSGLMGLMGGPWGLAMAGVSVGLDYLAQKQQQAAAAAEEHRQRISSLTQALQASHGVIDASVRATAVQTLANAKLQDSNTTLLDVMHRAGVNATQLTDAYLGQGGSVDDLRARLLKLADANREHIAGQLGSDKAMTKTGQDYAAAADLLKNLSGELPTAISRQKELADAVNSSGTSAANANDPMVKLRQDTDKLRDAEASATEKAQALRDAWKQLTGGSLDYQAALAQMNQSILNMNTAWKDGVDQSKGFGAALLDSSGNINTATENGQKLFQQMQSLGDETATATQAAYDYAKASGKSVPDAIKQAEDAMQKSRDALIQTGEQLGLTADQAGHLADQIGLVPSSVPITLALKDLNPTTASIMYVQGLADQLMKGAKVPVSALTDQAIKDLRNVGFTVDQLPDKTLMIRANNADALSKLQRTDAYQLSDKWVTVHLQTVGGDQYGHGMPSAPGYADGGVAPKASGVLYGANGFTVPGYAPRRDIVPAMLAPGEGVLVPEAVRDLGGAPAISRINRQARNGGASLGGGVATLALSVPSGGQTVHVHNTFHVHGSVLAQNDLRDLVQQQMLRLGMTNSQTWQSYGRH